MIFKDEDEVIAFVKAQHNKAYVERAYEKQCQLTALYEQERPKLEDIKDRWYHFVAQEKKIFYRASYVNHSRKLILKIESHFGKIFNANGGNSEYFFKDENKVNSFNSFLGDINYGKGLFRTMKNDYLRLLISKPSSLIEVKKEDKSAETKVTCISRVWSIKLDKDYIEAVAIVDKIKDGAKYYSVFDDTYEWSVKQKSEYYFVEEKKEHYAINCCPFVFVSSKVLYSDNYVERASLIETVFDDLKTYNTYKLFDTRSKFKSGFEKSISSETSNSKGQRNKPLQTNINSARMANDDFTYPSELFDAAQLNTQNNDLFGVDLQIPFNQAMSPEFAQNLKNLFFQFEGNSDLLKFRQEDLDREEERILESVCGNGFGKNDEQGVVRTATEVMASFTSQQDVLIEQKQKIETVIISIIDILGKMFSKSYKACSIDLGDQFFLKSTDQLYTELEMLHKVDANAAIISDKRKEIFIYSTGGKKDALNRFELIEMLQPFTNIPNDMYIKNIVYYKSSYPFECYMYDNFAQILSRFENKYQPIDRYAATLNLTSLFDAFETIEPLFNEVAKEMYNRSVSNNFLTPVIQPNNQNNEY
jgi:hypothetical protein